MQRQIWNTIISRCGVFLCLLFDFHVKAEALSPVDKAQVKTLIYLGSFDVKGCGLLPSPAFVAANKDYLETLPFDGLVVYLKNPPCRTNVTASVMSFKKKPVSYETIMAVMAPMRAVSFIRLKQNYVQVLGSKHADFFDDWSLCFTNFANLARAAKDSGFKGVFFDNEVYDGHPLANYPNNCAYKNKSLSEYEAQARLRGKQLMQAMIANFPDIVVITAHGPYVSVPGVHWKNLNDVSSHNELAGPFFAGFLEATVGTPATSVDGGELYDRRTVEDFQACYDWRKTTIASEAVNCTFLPAPLRAAWPAKSSLAFGVYDVKFGGQDMNPELLRSTLSNALMRADKVVWLYTEKMSFLSAPGKSPAAATQEWIDAIRQGSR